MPDDMTLYKCTTGRLPILDEQMMLYNWATILWLDVEIMHVVYSPLLYNNPMFCTHSNYFLVLDSIHCVCSTDDSHHSLSLHCKRSVPRVQAPRTPGSSAIAY